MNPAMRQPRYVTTKLKVLTKTMLDNVTVSSVPNSFPNKNGRHDEAKNHHSDRGRAMGESEEEKNTKCAKTTYEGGHDQIEFFSRDRRA